MMLKLNSVVAAVHPQDDLTKAVLLTATSLAAKFDALTHVISVTPQSVTMSTSGPGLTILEGAAGSVAATNPGVEQEMLNAQKAAINAAIEELQIRPHLNQVQFAVGDPGTRIQSFAESVQADLLVIGSHQRDFWDKLIAGSTSEHVAKKASCGVFLVTQDFAETVQTT